MMTPASLSPGIRRWAVSLAWMVGMLALLGFEFAIGPIGLWRPQPDQIGAFAGFGIGAVLVCAVLAWAMGNLAPRMDKLADREDAP